MKYIIYAQIDLALRVIGEKRIDKPLVQTQLAPVVGNGKHIVNSGVHLP